MLYIENPWIIFYFAVQNLHGLEPKINKLKDGSCKFSAIFHQNDLNIFPSNSFYSKVYTRKSTKLPGYTKKLQI